MPFICICHIPFTRLLGTKMSFGNKEERVDKIAVLRSYVDTVLRHHPALRDFFQDFSIVWFATSAAMDGIHPQVVRDLLLLMDDDQYDEFTRLHGERLLIDDHEIIPPVFARVKSISWLSQDTIHTNRLPIALWLYENAIVLQDPGERFKTFLRGLESRFSRVIPQLIKAKYLELRSERHNLRDTTRLFHLDGMDDSTALIKAVIAKLALEVVFLAEHKAYPYKKLLFWAAEKQTTHGPEVLFLARQFWSEIEGERIIERSDDLIKKVTFLAESSGLLAKGVGENWWTHLI